ncbi:AlpA family transcriptional regulator [Gymnodinialimonas sp. 57CJ19]|uniref:helix-turn-helix transcriptional regulator n=1 Tax=Gymnodinialimonas sp. 57CJ19 TaxID=3138498 RepID=UPI0031343C89
MERHLRRQAVEEITGLSRSTLYAMISEGTFPRPVKLGKRAVGWSESSIQTWLSQRETA